MLEFAPGDNTDCGGGRGGGGGGGLPVTWLAAGACPSDEPEEEPEKIVAGPDAALPEELGLEFDTDPARAPPAE